MSGDAGPADLAALLPRVTRKTSSRPRDSQRSKLYRAEEILGTIKPSYPDGFVLSQAKGGTNNRWPSIEEAQTYVDSLVRARWFQSRWGQVVITVGKKTNGAATGTRHSRWSGTIQLPPWGRSEQVILHEVAHVLTPPGHAWHGPQYAAIMLTLVEHRIGKEAAKALRQSFVDNRVKYRNGLALVPKAGSHTVLTGKRKSTRTTSRSTKVTPIRPAVGVVNPAKQNLTGQELADGVAFLCKLLDRKSLTNGIQVAAAWSLLKRCEELQAEAALRERTAKP